MSNEPLSAREAAELAAQGQKAQQERNREAIASALAHAYGEIRTAAGGGSGLTTVQISVAPFGLTPDQRLAFSRALQQQGYKVRPMFGDNEFSVGWQAAPVSRESHTVLLRE